LTAALRNQEYAVDSAADGEEGLWKARTTAYDAMILDVMLPKLDGFTLLSHLRAEGNRTHVLMLTARDAVADRVAGLRGGADDYLVKPFALEELLARVDALCRRAYGCKSRLLTLGDLTIDTETRNVERANRSIALSAREYRLLEYLVRRQGQVVSRAEIEEHIYDDATSPLSNAVDSAICVLRRKIDADGAYPLIHTRRRHGYMAAVLGGETSGPS
jgi:DNA-binding response OmpR family regulator